MNTPGSIFILSLLFIPASSVDMSTGKCKSEDDNSCKDPSAFHGEANEETNLLQTAVQIKKHQEANCAVSPETSLIQTAVKAECPTDPEKLKDLKNVWPHDSCCMVWQSRGHCKDGYAAWMMEQCAEACCDTTPTPPGTTIMGEPNTNCDDTCAVVDMVCDDARLQSVDTEEEAIQIAGEAVISCNGTVGWGYDVSPCQCTSATCCGDGSCMGICAYGKASDRSCSAKTWWASRFCPCKDLTTAEAEAKEAEAKAAAAKAENSATILGEPDKSCEETCSTIGYVCDDVRLQGVDSAAEVLELAGEAGITCGSTIGETVGWGYDYSPSQCTSATCCGDGSCMGVCTYGLKETRSCSVKAGGDHQRLCPCTASASLLSDSAKSKKDKKRTEGKK